MARLICIGYLTVFLAVTHAQYIGDSCILRNRQRGKCTIFKSCSNATGSSNPPICGFQGNSPIICCDTKNVISSNAGLKTGISEEQCKKWQVSKKRINFDDYPLAAFGGLDSLAREFPHMAALGYGSSNDIKWFCGGSLISEKFVLTAAHCINTRDIGDVQFVRIGDLDLKKTNDFADPQNFHVVRRIKHPQYRPPQQYHDIALIELDRPVQFTDYVYPACLQSTTKINNDRIIATGWGRLGFYEAQADHLQKVYLVETRNEDCRKSYRQDSRKLPNGIVDQMQICATGDKMDTCQGDSGGPLQAPSTNYSDVFVIIGVTSFGKACGITNSPGVYTRVSNYLDWIESNVWKNESLLIN